MVRRCSEIEKVMYFVIIFNRFNLTRRGDGRF